MVQLVSLKYKRKEGRLNEACFVVQKEEGRNINKAREKEEAKIEGEGEIARRNESVEK